MQNGIRKVVSSDEGHRHAVDAELVDEAAAEPVLLLDELKGRRTEIELRIGDERQAGR